MPIAAVVRQAAHLQREYQSHAILRDVGEQSLKPAAVFRAASAQSEIVVNQHDVFTTANQAPRRGPAMRIGVRATRYARRFDAEWTAARKRRLGVPSAAAAFWATASPPWPRQSRAAGAARATPDDRREHRGRRGRAGSAEIIAHLPSFEVTGNDPRQAVQRFLPCVASGSTVHRRVSSIRFAVHAARGGRWPVCE